MRFVNKSVRFRIKNKEKLKSLKNFYLKESAKKINNRRIV
tara:strand:+ start:298 stop:417 length:120 start_codon:yes stop_codon:yes gene_type:complete